MYSLYTFFFQPAIGVQEESLQRIFMSSYMSSSQNWTLQELIFNFVTHDLADISLFANTTTSHGQVYSLYTFFFQHAIRVRENLYKEYL